MAKARRGLLGLAVAAALVAVCGVVQAQSWPAKPVRPIVRFPPGGGNDVIARVVARKPGERLGQPVVVENRAGANGIVGLQA